MLWSIQSPAPASAPYSVRNQRVRRQRAGDPHPHARSGPHCRRGRLTRRSSARATVVGPPGSDFAAHLYQSNLLENHGFGVWNNFWYAGRYSFVTYSLLYYPLAVLLGIKLLAVASIAAAAVRSSTASTGVRATVSAEVSPQMTHAIRNAPMM